MSTSPRISRDPLDLHVPAPSFILACEKELVDPVTREVTPLGQRSLWRNELDQFLPPYDVREREDLLGSLRAELTIAVSRIGIRLQGEVQQRIKADYKIQE